MRLTYYRSGQPAYINQVSPAYINQVSPFYNFSQNLPYVVFPHPQEYRSSLTICRESHHMFLAYSLRYFDVYYDMFFDNYYNDYLNIYLRSYFNIYIHYCDNYDGIYSVKFDVLNMLFYADTYYNLFIRICILLDMLQFIKRIKQHI